MILRRAEPVRASIDHGLGPWVSAKPMSMISLPFCFSGER
jgi:hypothetical protein